MFFSCQFDIETVTECVLTQKHAVGAAVFELGDELDQMGQMGFEPEIAVNRMQAGRSTGHLIRLVFDFKGDRMVHGPDILRVNAESNTKPRGPF